MTETTDNEPIQPQYNLIVEAVLRHNFHTPKYLKKYVGQLATEITKYEENPDQEAQTLYNKKFEYNLAHAVYRYRTGHHISQEQYTDEDEMFITNPSEETPPNPYIPLDKPNA